MKTFIMNIWNKFSDSTKVRIISIFNTFGTTFILTIAITLTSGEIVWTGAFWLGLLVAGGREAFKAVVNTFVSRRLGGRKVSS